MRRRTGELQIFSLSFMDLLSCALGGILLLYLAILTQSKKELEAYSTELRKKDAQTALALEELSIVQSKKSTAEEKVKQLRKAQNTLVGFKGEMKNVVFVFDHSGSMATNNFPEYIELLKGYVTSLPFDSFSVVMFGHEVKKLNSSLDSNSKSDRSRGVRFIGGFKADGKCTATQEALSNAFSYANVDTIVLMSDGAPTQPRNGNDYDNLVGIPPAEVLAMVSKLNRQKDVTINTVAMGEYFRQPSLGPFLQQLAHDNGGEFIGR